MFKEAFQAEAERSELLREQLQATLAARLQGGGSESAVSVSVESAASFSPDVLGGMSTWQEAFEAAKQRTQSLEQQLDKAWQLNPSNGALEEAAEARRWAEGSGPSPSSAPNSATAAESSAGGDGLSAGLFQILDAEKRDPDSFKKLEDIAQNVLDDESALRLIAVPILGQRKAEWKSSLPPLQRVQEVIGSDEFAITSAVPFERVYVMPGQVTAGVPPGAAFRLLRERLVGAGLSETTELFLQRGKQTGQSVLLVMLKEDLPKDDFAWWQWLLFGLALVATLISVNIETFSVSTLTQEQLNAMSVDQMMTMASKTVPSAASILAVVASQEAARRAAASRYAVNVTPPFLVPVWPFPSVGCFGAITRRLSTVPHEEANLAMSAAAGLAGYLVSILLLTIGLVQGPDPDKLVNLNYQLLPLVLKVVLRPILGQSSATEQPDPFSDPVTVAFPANSLTIGGIIGLIITSLNMLPIGRLDGGTITRSALGGSVGGFARLGGQLLLLTGGLGNNEASLLFVTFAFYSLIFQSGYDCPARDAVSEPDVAIKALAIGLVVLGIILSLPGSLLPGV